MFKLFKLLFDVILVFCYVFAFRLRAGMFIDSSLIVFAYLILFAIFHPRYITTTKNILFSGYFKTIYKFYFLINLWATLVVLINGSVNFSFHKTFLHMLFVVVLGALLYSYFDYKGKGMKTLTLVILAFALQSVIEWSSFILPPVREFIYSTKSEDTIKKAMEYSGMRVNGLCGSDFFGLSAGFAFVFITFMSKMNLLFENNRVAKGIFFVLLISGTFFAGRTGYIGALVALIYFFITRDRYRRPFNTQEKISSIVLVGLFIAFIIFMVNFYYTNDDFNMLIHWTFQNVFNYMETGSAQSTSTETLKHMYFPIEFGTFLFGDGMYDMPDGSYYMATDAGYMRIVLFMGIIGELLMMTMMYKMLDMRNKHEKKLKWFMLLLILILNYKGEVIMWSMMLLAIYTIYCVQDKFSQQNNVLYQKQ